MLDLTQLNSGVVSEIVIDETMNFPESLLETTEILDLHDVHVYGKITKNSNLDNVIHLSTEGKMTLSDAISLEPVEYPFSFEITDEILEKEEANENSLDFVELLWENIVLEIPLKFTTVSDLSGFQGSGWKLISEDELKEANNPFNDLKSKLGEE